MNEELDSQLSAMFDGELPPAECELLARRLSRDEQLKARWGRYAAIGATIRAEGGVRLNADLARRVSAAIVQEPNLAAAQAVRASTRAPINWMRPVAGLGVAAGVAALSIVWLRSQGIDQPVIAPSMVAQVTQEPAPQAVRLLACAGPGCRQPAAGGAVVTQTAGGQPDGSYVVPKPSGRRSMVGGTELANYVVAHSEFSSPMTRRNLLSALMAGESGTGGTSAGSEETSEDVYDDAQNPQ
jgi:sigma-E factor negative regulatory protein RseA